MSHQNLFHRTIPLELKLKMPTGCEYSQKEKQLIFNVINFVESEKNGWKIPLYNVNERLEAMLGISMRSVERLKSEFREDRERLTEEIRRTTEEELKKHEEKHELTLRLRHRSSSRAERRFSPMRTQVEQAIPVARAPSKTTHSGHLAILLSEQQQEHIR
jgi:hypothetical protein